LQILEGFSDEFRMLAAETMTQLFKPSDLDGGTDESSKE
jgi:hypothetical protein